MTSPLGWEWQLTPFTPILFAAGGVMLAIAGYSYRHREETGARAFAVLMGATALWATTYGFQHAGATEATKRFWANLVHVGVAIVPVAWVWFTLRLTARERWLRLRVLVGLSIVPAIYIALVWTNEYHLLVREPMGLEQADYGSFLVWRQEFGPAFWAHAAYGYSLVVAGTLLLAHLFIWSPAVHRRQATLLVVGAVMPAVINVVHHAGFNPVGNFDLTPFSFTISGIIFLFAIFHYRLFDLAPVARAMVLDTLEEGILVVDQTDRVVDLNGAATDLLRTDRDAAIGTQFDRLLPADAVPTTSPRNQGDDESVPKTVQGRPSAVADQLLAPDDAEPTCELLVETGGDRQFLHFAARPVRDVRGDRIGRTVVVRDVTQTRELQAEVDATLERLRQSNAELEAFASVISHDLQGPLRTTERYLSLLEDEIETDESELLAVAQENAQRAQEMVADLLEYSKIDQSGVQFESVDCNEVLEAVLEGLRFEIEDRNATVTVEDLPTIDGVEHLLTRLFQNLLQNALTYAGDDPPHIHIAAEEDHGDWAITVRDEGIGMDENTAERVTELFVRGNRTDDHDGTGMGLAICKKITTVHGGDLSIDSAPGEGTTVTVTLPATQEATSPQPA